MPQSWNAILLYSICIVAATESIYLLTKTFMNQEGAIHIEVLMPAFVLGMVMKAVHHHSRADENMGSLISYLFMFLVGLSTPLFVGIGQNLPVNFTSITASQPMPSWGVLCFHVVMVTLLSNVGKMIPMFFYRDRDIRERLALSIGMFTRGEVGAGIIVIALGYNLGGPAMIISILSLVLNLVLTGGFVIIVRRLARSVYGREELDAAAAAE